MKKLFTLIAVVFLFISKTQGQSVWMVPTIAGQTTINDEVTIYFDPESSSFWDEGPQGVFVHAGVAVTGAASTDWTYGNGDWNDFSDSRKMAVNGSIWSKTIVPKAYFNIPDGVVAYRIQLLFRNEYDTNSPNNKEDNNGSNYFITLDPTLSGVQMIEVSPIFPTATDLVTVTFNASATSDSILVGASKVYFHAAAVTSGPTSTTWDYATGNWGQDDGVGEMTSLGNDTWSFSFIPETYFGVSDPEENIFRLAMVFRNADGSIQQKNEEGSDIIYDIDPGFHLLINDPSSDLIVLASGDTFQVGATSSDLADFSVTLGSNVIHTSTGTSISLNETYNCTAVQNLTISATSNGIIKSKTLTVSGYSAITRADVPANMMYGINYDDSDNTKATLVLHLPTQTKEVVHVIGDFNNWEVLNSYTMNRNLAGDTWWYTLTGLTPGQEYIFQYLVDGELRVADPYAEKISDPYNDQYIANTVYTGLLPYPNGLTSEIASYLQTAQPEYVWDVTNFQVPAHNKLNIYEIHFRDFTEEGTYVAATAKLDYIANLGINCIHVMPVSEFEGNDSWGYNPNFYFAADKAYGTPDDLKEFIDEAHKRGIAVINDLVLNHSFNSNVMARLYWNEAANNPADDNPWFRSRHNLVNNTASHWGSDYNHDSPHTEQMVDRITDYWMSEFNFDGFRFDFTKGFTNTEHFDESYWGSGYDQSRIDNLMRMANNMWSNHPGSIVIFEHLADNSENKILADNGILHWSGVSVHNQYKELILGWNNTDISEALSTSQGFNYDNWISYMESHDEQRLGYELIQYGRDFIKNNLAEQIKRLKLAATFNMLLPGPRMVWQFGELGYDVDIDYNGRTGRKPVMWNYFEDPVRKELYDHYALLLNLRKEYDVFHNMQWSVLNETSWVKHLNFQNSDTLVAVFANFAAYQAGDPTNVTPAGYNEPMNFLPAGDYYELISGEVHTIGANYYIPAGEIRIYSNYNLSVDKNGLTGNLDFGDVAVGNSSIKSFTINNYLNSDLQINSITMPNGYVANWNTGIIPVGQTQTVDITFSPSNKVEYEGSVILSTNSSLFTTNSLPIYGNSAVVTVSPTIFTSDDEITLTFHATLADGDGTSGLVGVDQAYIHTGVVTSGTTGTTWSYTQGNWGTADTNVAMTPVDGTSDNWSFSLTPSSFYGAPNDTDLYRLAMVFRNADGSLRGKGPGDIYIDINTNSGARTNENLSEKLTATHAENPSVTIYPNPSISNGQVVFVKISGIKKTKTTLQIMDLNGKIVYVEEVALPDGNATVPLSIINKLDKGMYLLTIPDQKLVHKIVVH